MRILPLFLALILGTSAIAQEVINCSLYHDRLNAAQRQVTSLQSECVRMQQRASDDAVRAQADFDKCQSIVLVTESESYKQAVAVKKTEGANWVSVDLVQ